MASIKKLEEDLAKTTDTKVREQLQELIDKRKEERKKYIVKLNNIIIPIINSVLIIIGLFIIVLIVVGLLVKFDVIKT